ncbi:MAG TPA: BlaI/MecI/CopY family transcriptional regulator [candidate division Zixibacteria bacterium]|jgi:predicted transcriptional regulator|nr:BlaI/MecI/CopY family transcriptional regulator [Candidatus Latescibacterota bacterium]MDP7238253.1 BlaI/MecI/CopY family transcriptional regulator [Candidatus Latescibacterota bacterium]HIG47676.1 BlaI/MecI/CopY family transcriptional regulator [candidate division Zixibacteria bacterium]
MPRKKLFSLTDLELDVMNIVWRLGHATVRQIVEGLREQRPLAYTTVQTVLTILTQKGFVEYTQQGRAYLYRAIIQSEGVRRETVSAVVDKLFAGSSRSLVLHLIDSDKFTIEEAQNLKELLDQRLTEDTNA